MGECVVINVADNAALQRAVSDAIARAQVSDPLAPVTLVVDSAAQAWTLRRQIAEASAPGTGIANVRAMTLVEFLSLLADRAGVTTPASTDRLLEAAVVEALLRAETGPLSASADHPETALRLASLGGRNPPAAPVISQGSYSAMVACRSAAAPPSGSLAWCSGRRATST